MSAEEYRFTERQWNVIRHAVESGAFPNEAEVLDAALDLLERSEGDDQAKLQHIRGKIERSIAQFERGEYYTLESDEDIDRFMDEIEQDISPDNKR